MPVDPLGRRASPSLRRRLDVRLLSALATVAWFFRERVDPAAVLDGRRSARFDDRPYLSDAAIARRRRRRGAVAPAFELCDDCRLRPGGKPVTCLERATYLSAKHKLAEAAARAAVMRDHARCNMTRYPVDLPEATAGGEEGGRRDGFVSVLSELARPATAAMVATGARETDGGAADEDGLIAIYVYDTLAPDMGLGMERALAAEYASGNRTYENFKTDLVLLHRLRAYRGRTRDPTAAELFVVPFAAASFCLWNSTAGWRNECRHVPEETIRRGVLDRLSHHAGNEARHLFLNVMERFHAHPLLAGRPLQLTLGPRLPGPPASHQIVVPYLNDQRAFAPAAVARRPIGWWTRPRTYSLAYFFSALNPKMKFRSPRRYRVYFLEEVQRHWGDAPDLGGLPYVVRNVHVLRDLLQDTRADVRAFFPRLYAESLFCPVFPGDSPWQKHFFDVIMMGCIPVVYAFRPPEVEEDNEEERAAAGGGRTSWYLPGSHGVVDCLPWAKGSNVTYPHLEIDYRSFVVEVPWSEGNASRVRPVLEALMRNASEIRRRQLALREHAAAFTYRVGEDDGREPPSEDEGMDAFARILASLRFYLSNL